LIKTLFLLNLSDKITSAESRNHIYNNFIT
jgi:hypothetical protein